MERIYDRIKKFKEKYSSTIAWRIKAHSKIVEKHLNPGETLRYAFAAQIGYSTFDIFSTYAVVLTNKRIILAQKRLLFGYTFLAVTPDMFNDLTVHTGIIWSKVNIDTVKERIVLSNIAKGAVDEIETEITEYMMNEKKKIINSVES